MPAVTSSNGPVAVTGASGYIGAHTIIALLKRGYEVRACVTDLTNPDKTEFLKKMNDEHEGSISLHQANLLEAGSYDDVFAECSAVLHVGQPEQRSPTGLRWFGGRYRQHHGFHQQGKNGQAPRVYQFVRGHRTSRTSGTPIHRKRLGI